MTHTAPARAEAGRASWLVLAGLAVALAAIIATAGPPSLASSVTSFDDVLRGDHQGVLGEADGVVPDGTTVFDDVPAVSRLDPDLLRALRRAAEEAADARVELQVNSGWRSPEYQEQLLREAISRYGSAAAAARWVATPDTSPHVAGVAIDIGPADAATWLAENGAAYGLCQIYRNEPWHYELRPSAVDHGCPSRYADPAHDPRVQR